MKLTPHRPYNILACSLLALLGLLPRQASAAITYFEGFDVGQSFSLVTSGTFGGTGVNPTSLLHIITDVNDTNITMGYDLIQVSIPSFTTTNTVNFTVGLGQTASVTTAITYDPILITASSAEALALTATTGGNFNIAQFTAAFFPALALSGHYTVTGPTQTVSGTFQTSSLAAQNGVNGFRWGTYNSIGYPSTGQLTNPQPPTQIATTHWGTFGTIIDTTVDGAHVTASIDSGTALAAGFGTVPLNHIVPEPASALLLGFGALGLGARRRRG